MKNKLLAFILALSLVIAMLPGTAWAAPVGQTAPIQVQSGLPVQPEALPELPAVPNGDHKITATVVKGAGHGEVKLSASSGDAMDRIELLVNPDDGYLAEIGGSYEYRYHQLELYYVGRDIYSVYMPDGNVSLEISFVKAEGDSHDVTAVVNDPALGTMTVSRSSAKAGESVVVEATPAPGCKLVNLYAVDGNGGEVQGGYLGEEDGVEVFEIVMPNEELLIGAEFEALVPHKITWAVFPAYAGSIVLSHETAIAGEIVTVQFLETPGYHLETRTCNAERLDYVSRNTYTFVMPDYDVQITGEYRPYFNYASVTVENNGLGGTAVLDGNGGVPGAKLTLTCKPDEGYRIARIIGEQYLTDRGEGCYTLTMPGGVDVNLSVLFLRHDNPFFDVNETQFFYDSVLWAVEQGITNGIDTNNFGPYLDTNRAAVVTMLWRYAGSPEPASTDLPFADVPADSWYAKAVLWAVEQGITNGVSETEFGPTLVCNRAQVVTFLWRFLGQPESELAEHPFTDVEAGGWYEPAVLWALENGITTGATATTFDPVGKCLRAHFVTFLYRTAQLPPPPPTYAIHWSINGLTDTPSNCGTVTLSRTRAQAGKVITATVLPAEGWQIEWVQCASGAEITQVSDTEYTFVMPDQEETFQVSFTEIPAEPDPTPGPGVPPSEEEGTAYVLNTSTLKFHYPSCWMVEQISEENYHAYLGTRDTLLAYGYSPCGHCDP